MKLTILLASLLFAATSAKGVYVEGATTDSSVVEADVAAAKLGANEAPAANHRGLACAGATCPGRRMDQAAEAVVAAAKLGANEAPRRGLGGQSDDRRMDQTAEAVVAAAKLGANEAQRRALTGDGKGGSGGGLRPPRKSFFHNNPDPAPTVKGWTFWCNDSDSERWWSQNLSFWCRLFKD